MAQSGIDGVRVKTAEITMDGFKTLVDTHLINQIDWVVENVDSDAVGIKSIAMEAEPDSPPGFGVQYYVERPKPSTREALSK